MNRRDNAPLWAILAATCAVFALVSLSSYHAIGQNDGPQAGLIVFATGWLAVLASGNFLLLFLCSLLED